VASRRRVLAHTVGRPKAAESANNRLTKAGSTAYEYDSADNHTQTGSSTNTYNEADELTKGTGVEYSYDKLGERTKRTPTKRRPAWPRLTCALHVRQ
jgi:hypothetical protein